jgi:8-amino-7-oxononanoate synthase
VVSSLAEPGDVIFSDALNHASLIDGCRLSRAQVVVVPHRDLDAMEAALASTPATRRKLILSDTVFSMDGDVADVASLRLLADRHHAGLVSASPRVWRTRPDSRGVAAAKG